nr:hypothetical protein GTC16762_33660 [Pigmentibacter ruber]
MDSVIKSNIQKFIEREKVNVSFISKKTGVSVSTLCRILSGEIKNPNRSTVEQLSKYFKAPIEKLLDDDRSSDVPSNMKDRLNYLMKKARINVEDLSLMADVSISSIRSILSGDTLKPNWETCSKISDFFGITIEQLKCEDDLVLEADIYRDIPILKLKNVKNWIVNKSDDYIHSFKKYVIQNTGTLFCIFIEDSSYFFEYEIGDQLIFEKTLTLNLGTCVAEIDGVTNLFQIYSTEGLIKYRFIGSPSMRETEVNNVNIFGKLIEIKVK